MAVVVAVPMGMDLILEATGQKVEEQFELVLVADLQAELEVPKAGPMTY